MDERERDDISVQMFDFSRIYSAVTDDGKSGRESDGPSGNNKHILWVLWPPVIYDRGDNISKNIIFIFTVYSITIKCTWWTVKILY